MSQNVKKIKNEIKELLKRRISLRMKSLITVGFQETKLPPSPGKIKWVNRRQGSGIDVMQQIDLRVVGLSVSAGGSAQILSE